MNLMTYLRRIEILFWKASVGLMKNQRAFRWTLIFLVLLILATIWGIGSILTRPRLEQSVVDVSVAEPELRPVGDIVEQEIARPAGPQTNLLVILVDSLEAEKPVLNGIWLVGRSDSAPQIVFLPLYPVLGDSDPDGIAPLFGFSPEGQLTEEFSAFLRSKDIWWDHFLIVDSTSLVELIELSGGIAWNGVAMSGAEIVASLPESRKSPEAALRAQAQIAGALCNSASEWIHNADPEILWGLFTHRMRSDIQLNTVQSSSFRPNQSEGGVVCAFPTMQATTFWSGSD